MLVLSFLSFEFCIPSVKFMALKMSFGKNNENY